MALLSRLRAWIADRLGVDTDTGGEGEGPDGLDPDNVTEVRTESDDGAVEKLREIRDASEEDEQ